PVGGELARERARHPEPLKLAMQPVGELLVLVAIAQERIVSSAQPRRALSTAFGFPRALKPRYSGKLGHRPPPAVPLTPLTQCDKSRDHPFVGWPCPTDRLYVLPCPSVPGAISSGARRGRSWSAPSPSAETRRSASRR